MPAELELRIIGMDCAEEVTLLKRELLPVIGSTPCQRNDPAIATTSPALTCLPRRNLAANECADSVEFLRALEMDYYLSFAALVLRQIDFGA